MKRIAFFTIALGVSLFYLSACQKEDLQAKNASAEEQITDRKAVPVICALSDEYYTTYGSLGIKLFGDGFTTTSGTIDKHLNCPQDYWDRCNVVNASFVHVIGYDSDPNNVNGYAHPLSDGVMTVAEQNVLVNQIRNACQNYINANFTASHEVIHYDVHYVYPLCCNSMSVYVDFTAATRCR